MRAVIQRVTRSQVSVDGSVLGEIGPGLVILAGVGQWDKLEDTERLAAKIAGLRIFSDAQGKTNLSILDVDGEALVISQFTLFADCRKGRRPSFTDAAPPEVAAPLVDHLAAALRQNGVRRVEMGRFGAMMMVELNNEGPFTIWLDSSDLARKPG